MTLNPKVSILCVTYNHAAFLEITLKGFIQQETDFQFEVVVHDDCSTDGTTEILRKYAAKYPDMIIPLYEEQNCYSRGIRLMQPLLCTKLRGEYVALCEGDDYWCDPKKLQKQYDYMRQHPDCSLLMHNGYLLDMLTGRKSLLNPYPTDQIISDTDAIVETTTMPPTASMFFKLADIQAMPQLFWDAPVGDRPRRMYLLLKGYIYYMNDAMCVYRLHVPGSFSERTVAYSEQRKKVLDRMLTFFDQYDEYTKGKFHDEVELIRSREFFHYFIRCGKKGKAIKTEYFKKMYKGKARLRFILSAYMPDQFISLIKRGKSG